MKQSRISVLLVEDDHDLRDSVTEWLEIAGMTTRAVGSAAEFHHVLPQQKFHVAVVDIGLPDQSGYVLAEYIRANTNMAIIMLTARAAVDDKVKAYDCGADLYMVKPVDCRELSAAIVSIVRRRIKPAADLSPTQDHWTISASEWKLSKAGSESISLSAKELKFLELLGATPGQSVPRAMVLAELYQRHDYYTERSLDSMVRRLRAKVIAKTGATIPIRTVHAIGYCFVGAVTVC